LLALRGRPRDGFSGRYEPLEAGEATCAYQRGDDVVVVVPTRAGPPEIALPAGRWRNVLDDLGSLYDGAPAVYERID
jgi:hypothetical protein